jgi:hypothetical protein
VPYPNRGGEVGVPRPPPCIVLDLDCVLFLYGPNVNRGGLEWATRIVDEDAADNDTGGGQQSG